MDRREIGVLWGIRRRHAEALLQPLGEGRGKGRDGGYGLQLAEAERGQHRHTMCHSHPDEAGARSHPNVGGWAVTRQWHLIDAAREDDE